MKALFSSFEALSDKRLWVLALILSFPMGVLSSLTASWLENYWAERNKEAATAQIYTLEEKLIEVEKLAKNQFAFRDYLLFVVIKTTAIGALVGVLSGLFFAAPTVLNTVWKKASSRLMDVFHTAGFLVSLIGGLMVYFIASDGIETYLQVTSIEEYKTSVAEQINLLNKVK